MGIAGRMRDRGPLSQGLRATLNGSDLDCWLGLRQDSFGNPQLSRSRSRVGLNLRLAG